MNLRMNNRFRRVSFDSLLRSIVPKVSLLMEYSSRFRRLIDIDVYTNIHTSQMTSTRQQRWEERSDTQNTRRTTIDLRLDEDIEDIPSLETGSDE